MYPIVYLDCIHVNRPLKNVFEAADARQKQAKKRSLCLINEHFESVFNTAAATQIVFQRPVKARDTDTVRVKAVYLALGINLSGEKELLGIWIACVDGLKGFPEAIEAGLPQDGCSALHRTSGAL